jgi:lipopolysaccharide transport system ATP-binding protein
MSRGFAIRTEGLGKRYVLGSQGTKHTSLRDALVDSARRALRFGRGSAPKRDFWALRDANIEIGHGENVGVIGLNGAGKSTLLKMLSRIVEPSAGVARIHGRVGALLEVGTGFSGELTGRENVFLYGAILGMRREEIARKFDAIVAFAGVEKFIDTPVKRYSSGMYVRLAFAVAAHLEPEILLLDEVLAVGDVAFQQKCMDFAKDLQRRDATILFVSHNMFSIKTMCERVIYLKQGRVEFDGSTDAGIARYEEDCRLGALWTPEGKDNWPIRVTDIAVMNENGEPQNLFPHGSRMRLRLTYETSRELDNPNFIIAFIRSDGVAACNFTTESDGAAPGMVDGRGVLELLTPPLRLVSEAYTIQILVRAKGFQELLCNQIGSIFHTSHDLYDLNFGVFHEAGEFTWRKAANGPQMAQGPAIRGIGAGSG